MSWVSYFAYGSNMSVRRIQRRASSATAAGRAVLDGYRLTFHKISQDGSGKCHVEASREHAVSGVLFRMQQRDKARLDELETAGFGYQNHLVKVRLAGNVIETASTYLATRCDPALRPYTWYKQHVVTGAQEAGLSAPYIASLGAVAAVRDPDRARELRELAVYRRCG